MALTNFVDGTTRIVSTWLNRVDVLLDTVFQNATTAAQARAALGVSATGTDTTYNVKTANLSDVSNAASARTNLGLGTAATLAVGTSANNVVQLNGSAQLPAVDGSLLTGLPLANKNRVINGSMLMDARNEGTAQTFTSGAALAYSVDRWYGYCTGANVTGQQIASGVNKRYRFTGAASVTGIGFAQRIEALNSLDLAGQSATLQIKASSTSLTTLNWAVYYANTTDAFGTVASPTRTLVSNGSFTINTTEATYSTTVSLPAGATTGIEILFTAGALLAAQTLTLGDVQFEKGSSATAFETLPISISEILCKRYYEKSYPQGTKPGTAPSYPGVSTVVNTVAALGYAMWNTPFKVSKRAAPTMTVYNPQTGTTGQAVDSTLTNSSLTTSISATRDNIGTIWNSGTAFGAGAFGYLHWQADAEL